MKKKSFKHKNSLFSRIKTSGEQKKINLSKYAIVDSKGKIIEKFRNKITAKTLIVNLKREYYEELKIVKLE